MPRPSIELVFVLVAATALSSIGCQFERIKEGAERVAEQGTGTPFTEDGCIASCQAAGKNCGSISDGCGGTLACGQCGDSVEVCGANGLANVCCTPTTCAEQGSDCGEMSDGCGGVINCGECPRGLTCGAGGANVCGEGECPTLTTCAAEGADCGLISDGCGATLDCGTCSGEQTCGGAGQPNVCGTTGVDISTELETHCFGWPDQEFSPTNFTPVRIQLFAGTTAVDFTLRDTSGVSYTLSEMLAEKPVMLQLGSYTCPVYQRKIADTEQLAADFGDRVHFVVVYTVEAHPLGPDPSPYRGEVWEAQYTDYGNPKSYAGRVFNAEQLAGIDRQLVLVDELDGAGTTNNNPVWCTYGPAPNAGWLIDQSGEIVAAHDWFDADTMRTALIDLVGP